MAIGDHSGACTSMVITCQTEAHGDVSIKRGDAVVLLGSPFVVGHATCLWDPIFGQAMHDASGNGVKVDVKVGGLLELRYQAGVVPSVGCGGLSAYSGVVAAPSIYPGEVLALRHDSRTAQMRGIVVAVNEEQGTCTVLF